MYDQKVVANRSGGVMNSQFSQQPMYMQQQGGMLLPSPSSPLMYERGSGGPGFMQTQQDAMSSGEGMGRAGGGMLFSGGMRMGGGYYQMMPTDQQPMIGSEFSPEEDEAFFGNATDLDFGFGTMGAGAEG